jgi:hypothetical protein
MRCAIPITLPEITQGNGAFLAACGGRQTLENHGFLQFMIGRRESHRALERETFSPVSEPKVLRP